jgi:hypothetical protein
MCGGKKQSKNASKCRQVQTDLNISLCFKERKGGKGTTQRSRSKAIKFQEREREEQNRKKLFMGLFYVLYDMIVGEQSETTLHSLICSSSSLNVC